MSFKSMSTLPSLLPVAKPNSNIALKSGTRAVRKQLHNVYSELLDKIKVWI